MTLLFATSLALPLFAQPPHQAESPKQAESPAQKVARQFAANFTAGHFDAAAKDFNKALTAAVSPATMKGMSDQITAWMGAFQSITSVREAMVDGFPSVEVVMAHEKGPVSLKVVFDRSGRMGSVLFDPLLAATAVDPDLERSARALVADLMASRFGAVSAQFDDNMHRELPPPRLADLVWSLNTTFGTFLSVTEVQQRSGPEVRIVDLTAACDKRPVKVSVVFNPKSKVSGIVMTPK